MPHDDSLLDVFAASAVGFDKCRIALLWWSFLVWERTGGGHSFR